ncbi:phage Gp37/Gp68 family protein [Treponema denticola]|uniref:DUF5131 family protein n=1 Tax=Treponema denticola TaxID=158 RepID=UPI0020A59032|nr:phage Gp37/Gp68 family protein [Treponema denticola]UTC96097.1 phage Gp37/Gp68 family protein [Treponema denticola]
MNSTKIEWTDSTWNPATGCTKISEGCRHCYAEKMAGRLKCMGSAKYSNGFKLTLHPDTLEEPYKWKKPRMVFVNSMSDMFHEDIPLEYIKKVFKVMNENPQHVFQVLTKRAELLEKYASELVWSSNIWMGVTVEHQNVMYRIDLLSKVPASIKFLSCEPLLSPLYNMNLSAIDWVIVGGESGSGARPMEKKWVEDIKEQCEKNQTAFFFKQWGGINKKKNGRELDGKTYSEMPSLISA